MTKLAIRYSLIVVSVVFLFSGFIACGAQMYKVAVDNDIDSKQLSASANDQTSTVYGIHAPNGWANLPIAFKVGTELTSSQFQGIKKAMGTWEWAVGKMLFKFDGVHQGTTGDSFKDLYSSLNDMINGLYMDFDWKKTAKPEMVLATTIWQNKDNNQAVIETSDVRYNTSGYTIGDSLNLTKQDDKEVVDIESLSLHELGHLLGLAHVEESIDPVSIMNPTLYIGEGLTSRKLSRFDIERIQTIYGCDGKSCSIDSLVSEAEYNLKKSSKEENLFSH